MSMESKYWSLELLNKETAPGIFAELITNKLLSYGTTNNGRYNGTYHGYR